MSQPMESQEALMLTSMPGEVLRRTLLHAGIKSTVQLSGVNSEFQELCSDDSIWDELSRLVWPPETLPPVSQAVYPSAHALVKHGNRQGSWISWIPNEEQELEWFWKYNTRNSYRNFYAGKITQIAIDPVAGDLCFYIHAVSNYPDLRAAVSSSLYAVHRDPDGDEYERLPRPGHKLLHQRFHNDISRRPGLIEEKVILRWSLSDLSSGQKYTFFYATQSRDPDQSDYPATPAGGLNLDHLITLAHSPPGACVDLPEGMRFTAPFSDDVLEPLEQRFPYPQLQRTFPECTFSAVGPESSRSSTPELAGMDW